jgi:hypothetical protein
LCTLRIVPDCGIFQFTGDRGELIEFPIVVKDTSGVRWRAARCPPAGWRSD